MTQTANKSKTSVPSTPVPGWTDFKAPEGGTAQDMRRRAAEIQTRVNKERKVFADNSIVNGGTKVKG